VPEVAGTDKLTRKVITGERVMAAEIRLKKGSVVPLHSHEAEQLSYIRSGALKFVIEGQTHLVKAGDILVIPPWVKHEAVALEDTDDLDVFSPIRWDWLEGTDSYFHQPPSAPAGFENPATGSNPARLVRLADLPVEHLTPFLDRVFLSGQNSTLADIKLKKGCVVPVHQHESEQITLVRRGVLRLELEGKAHDLDPGSVLVIPSQVPHQAVALEDCEVMDLFGPRREDWINQTDAYIRQGNR
jgi:quercetin dioxygenase-like cupin family protein